MNDHEKVQPVREIRSPQAHYEIADRLVAELDDMQPHELVLPHGKSKMVLADLHARLAQCVLPDYVDDDDLAPCDGDRSMCAHCGKPVVQHPINGWLHAFTGIAYCYRDPQHTETATPSERI